MFDKMDLPRNYGRTLRRKNLSQSSVEKQNNRVTTLSQPVPSTSATIPPSTFWRRSQNSSPDRINIFEEENQLVNRMIRYILALDRRKQVTNKTRIIKHVLDNRGKHFLRIMNKAKNLLSKIFGYRLMELEGNKYILVNEIQNKLPHIRPSATEGSQQVLLLIVLIHVFMHQQSCTEESLWNFLTNLGISCSNNHCHPYFGNVKYLINEVFVAQKYLDKTTLEKNNSVKIEFKWGPRAEHEFSRRTALNFVSQVYNGRPINSWPLQYQAVVVQKESN